MPTQEGTNYIQRLLKENNYRYNYRVRLLLGGVSLKSYFRLRLLREEPTVDHAYFWEELI